MIAHHQLTGLRVYKQAVAAQLGTGRIASQSVTGRPQEDRQTVLLAPAVGGVLRNIVEQQIAAIFDPYRPLAPVKSFGQYFDHCAFRNQPVNLRRIAVDRTDGCRLGFTGNGRIDNYESDKEFYESFFHEWYLTIWCHALRGVRFYDAPRRACTDLIFAGVTQSVTERIRRGASNENFPVHPNHFAYGKLKYNSPKSFSSPGVGLNK